MRTTDNYVFFWNGPFSQWHPSEFSVGLRTFCCAEQWMMYMKAVTFGDIISADRILATESPAEQKAFGRKVLGYNNRVWNEIRYGVVIAGNIAKFRQNEDLWEELRKTGSRTLVEASPYDTIWGVGLGENNPLIDDPPNWRGENLLGYALMDVRDQLLEEE